MCPMCAPAVQPGRACCCNLHVNHAMLAPDQIDAMPSQREAQLDHDVVTKLLPIRSYLGRFPAGTRRRHRSRAVHHTADCRMAWKQPDRRAGPDLGPTPATAHHRTLA